MASLVSRAVLWTGVFAVFSGAAPAEAVLQIRVQAAASGDSLSIEVVNRGTRTMTLPLDALPWRSPYRGFRLVVVPIDARAEPLPRVVHWDEPVEAPSVALKPSEPQSGEVQLDAWFDGFREAHSKHDVLVFWSWLPETHAGERTARLGGWLVIPRSTRGPR
jgi:hypothetical protein